MTVFAAILPTQKLVITVSRCFLLSIRRYDISNIAGNLNQVAHFNDLTRRQAINVDLNLKQTILNSHFSMESGTHRNRKELGEKKAVKTEFNSCSVRK